MAPKSTQAQAEALAAAQQAEEVAAHEEAEAAAYAAQESQLAMPGVAGTAAPSHLFKGMDGAQAVGASVPRNAIMEQYGDVFDEIDDIDQRGSKYKRMLLAQGQSKAVAIDQTAHAGEWVVNNFDGKKSVVIMPFSYATQRQYWRKPINVEEGIDPATLRDELACVSQVRLMKRSEPALEGEGDPGGPCAVYPNSAWQPNGAGTNRPPKCTLIHVIYAVSLDHECRVEIPLKKTSEKTAHEMLTILRTRGWGQVLLQLGAESDKNKAGQPYWKAKFSVIEATPEMVAKGAEIARRERESMGY